MEVVEGFDHRTGVHCGAAALRDVAAYYGWHYSEAACFGIGGGASFVLYEHPQEPWVTFRASPPWAERAFFERLGIPHAHRAGDEFDVAWEDVTARIDEDDPVILFLDPDELAFLPRHSSHLPAHVAVMTGYDGDTVQLCDGSLQDRQTIPRTALQEAWTAEGFVPLSNEFLVVTRARVTADETDAAAEGLRHAARHMLDPLTVKRDARGPGEEGLAALRSFADHLAGWPDLDDPWAPVTAAARSIDEHGDGTAFRALHGRAIEELGRRTGIAHDLADRMVSVAGEWETVRDRLVDLSATEEPGQPSFEEAGSLLGDIADREETIFEEIADELDTGRER